MLREYKEIKDYLLIYNTVNVLRTKKVVQLLKKVPNTTFTKEMYCRNIEFQQLLLKDPWQVNTCSFQVKPNLNKPGVYTDTMAKKVSKGSEK